MKRANQDVNTGTNVLIFQPVKLQSNIVPLTKQPLHN